MDISEKSGNYLEKIIGLAKKYMKCFIKEYVNF